MTTEFERVKLRSAVQRAWEIAQGPQGAPMPIWAAIAVNAVLEELRAWEERKERVLTGGSTSEYTSTAKKDE